MNAKKQIVLLNLFVVAALTLALAPAAQGAGPTAPLPPGPIAPLPPAPAILRDDFDGSLDPGWYWVNENPGEWSLDARPGFLTIWTSPTGTGGQNLLLRQAPSGDFTIQTYQDFNPFTNFEFAGLVLWQDDSNFLQFGRAMCTFCGGNGIYFDFILDGGFSGSSYATFVSNPGSAFLRLVRRGTSMRGYYSENGYDWSLIGEHILPPGFRINAVGLTSSQHFDPGWAIPADFDYFALDQTRLPFTGQWQAIDVDGGDMRLTVGGKPAGPFTVTWTESYFGFCGGEAGIARGVGSINPDDPYILDASLHLVCFTTGAETDFYPSFHYDPATGWLQSRDDGWGGYITTWHRPGLTLPLSWDKIIAHPDQEWVEGLGFAEGTVVSLFIYEPGHVLLFGGTAVATVQPWDPSMAVVQIPVGYDLKAGDHLWMSDGKVARDLVVSNLWVTGADLATETVFGVAEPGSEVIIEYFPPSGATMFSVWADQNGDWSAVVDGLEPGVPGLASQADPDYDLTRVEFTVPKLTLRVNYGDDWVESFFPAGHSVTVTVTDSVGSPKASATVVTAPRPEWGGAEGFQTTPADWVPAQPDIQPGDWVTASEDSGQTAQVQIGDISGTVDLSSDSILGAISAPWFTEEVFVECFPWGAPTPQEMKYDAVLPDGTDPYSCSWLGEWDVQPGEVIGVGYIGPDGNWVANSFYEP